MREMWFDSTRVHSKRAVEIEKKALRRIVAETGAQTG
jgi:formyltetrahydrofolate synthetase